MLKFNIRKIGAILLLAAVPVFAYADAVLDEAAALVKKRDFKGAYNLLEPLESDRAGEPGYDYMFGISAIETGKVTRGVFALERVLAVQPNNTDARAFIARAYFQLGEKETAKSEFQNTLGQKPSPAVEKAINDYMNAIDKSLGLVTTYNAYIEGTYGYDTNINSATGVNGFPVAGGGAIVLNKNAREMSDNFMSANVGASFRTPIAKDVDFFAGVNGSMRVNLHEEIFDTKSYDANAGLRLKQVIDTYTIAVQDSNFYVDSQRYRHAYGVTGQWQRDLSATDQVNAYVQVSRLDYMDQNRDTDRYVGGGGWAHVFAGDKTPVLFLSGYLGKEHLNGYLGNPATSAKADDVFGNDLYGVRLGGQLTMTPHWVAYANSAYEYRDYHGETPLFSKTREDNQYDFSVGLRYLGKVWVIKPQISYLKNDSNIAINDFDRTVASVSFRHDFDW